MLRVASNKRARSARDSCKVQIENMGHLVNRILVPMEKTKTIKGGKQRDHPDQALPGLRLRRDASGGGRPNPAGRVLLIKETTGVGDFVGTAGRPTPLQQHEIEKMPRQQEARGRADGS